MGRFWTFTTGGLLTLVAWLPAGSSAKESASTAEVIATAPTSLQALLTNVPAEAKDIATLLNRALVAFELGQEAKRNLIHLRSEQDEVKTQLVAVKGELEVLGPQRSQLETELHALEQQLQQRLEVLRKELETRLQDELTQTNQQIAKEQEREFTRQAQTFQANLRESIEKSLSQGLQVQERKIQQASQEIEALTKELLAQLAQLDAKPELAKSLGQSMSQAIAQRKGELAARRQQLEAERNALLEKRFNEFTAKLKQQQQVERQTRLAVKEASLRQAMAESLHKTRVQEEGRVHRVRQALGEITQRHTQLSQQQASLETRLQALEKDLAALARRMEELETDRQTSVVRFEQAFQKLNPGLHPESLTWFSQVIQQAPSEVAIELGLIQQRLLAQAEQERQRQEQQRVQRERELAAKVAQEMQRQLELKQEQQQQELEVKTRQVEKLLAEARSLSRTGRFDEALRLVAKAQVLNPPWPSAVAVVHDEIVAARDQALSQAQYAQVEALFTNAMQAFKQGRYEEAITLFEQVIAQETQLSSASGPSVNEPQANAR